MTPKKCLSILLLLAAASCGRSKMQRNQKQYAVVQEGSADGVTSTINAPGETAQTLTSSTITGTNVDTTTAFTVPGTATSSAPRQQAGTIAGTFPDDSGNFPSGYNTPRPRPRPRTPPQTTTNPPMDSSTDTAAPPTDTTGEKKDDEKPKPPPPTDTTATGTQG